LAIRIHMISSMPKNKSGSFPNKSTHRNDIQISPFAVLTAIVMLLGLCGLSWGKDNSQRPFPLIAYLEK
jgi:hypothetical protein